MAAPDSYIEERNNPAGGYNCMGEGVIVYSQPPDVVFSSTCLFCVFYSSQIYCYSSSIYRKLYKLLPTDCKNSLFRGLEAMHMLPSIAVPALLLKVAPYSMLVTE